MEENANRKKDSSNLIIGVDDSGRGPVLGPMILAGVLMTEEQEKMLKKEGAKDSKQLTHPARIKLAEIIKENSLAHKIVSASPDEIDDAVLSKSNLNTLEAQKTAEIINFLNNGKEKIKVIVDCPSVNIKAWRKTLISFLKSTDNLEIICEHKADVNHPSVSSASILAKVAREENVAKIKEKFAKYGDTGSGYPSDPATKKFLKEHGKELENSGIFRKSWQTWQAMFGKKEAKQQVLDI